MKIHSVVDVITNSSSTVFISHPNPKKWKEINEKLGKIIDINLSRKAFDEGSITFSFGGGRFGEVEFLKSKGLKPYEEWDKNELYEFLNESYLNGEIDITREEDALYYGQHICLEPELDITISGHNLRELVKLIDSIF